MSTWDPAHYEQFVGPRLQPGRDLINRIEHSRPGRIVDLGCGTGRLTEELAARWPEAVTTGVDRSPEMLPNSSPTVEYRLGDIEAWDPDAPVDIIFANASLHWLPHHERLFPRLATLLADGGMLAVQMPLSWDQPSHRALRSVAAEYGVESLAPPTLEPSDYYDALEATTHTEVWTTTYYHVLSGMNPVYSWVSATGMKRFLNRLEPRVHEEYRRRCAELIGAAYPANARGRTIFPFTRMFVLSRR